MNPNGHFGKLKDAKILKDALYKKFAIPEKMAAKERHLICADINKKIDPLLFSEEYGEILDPFHKYGKQAYDRVSKEYKRDDYLKIVNFKEEIYLSSDRLRRYLINEIGMKNYIAYALALASGISKDKLTSLKDESDTSDMKASIIQGAWDVYLFDSWENLMKKTRLWLKEKDKSSKSYSAEFVAPWGKLYKGIATITASESLVIELYNSEVIQPIFISGKIPEITSDLDSPILINAGGLTSGKLYPVTGSLILVRNTNYNKKEMFLRKGVDQVHYMDDPSYGSELMRNSRLHLVNQIIVYLTRHQDRAIKPFTPDSFEQLYKRNREYHIKQSRHSYQLLKEVLKQNQDGYCWYSFSRIPRRNDLMGFFEWTFTFKSHRQEVLARRFRANHSEQRVYSGEVTVESDHIYIRMQDEKKDNRKSFISDIPDGNDLAIKLKGLSTTTSIRSSDEESKRIAVREILVYMPRLGDIENQELQDGYIQYEDFLDIEEEFVTIEDKLYLAQRGQSTVTYPSRSNPRTFYKRQFQSLEFARRYYVFVRNLYEKNALFILTLEIDRLGSVTCRIPYEEGTDTYTGFAEWYAKNLHIRLEFMPNVQRRQKILVLNFDPILPSSIKNNHLLLGKSLDTNEDNETGAYPFIMLSEEIMPFEVFKPLSISDVFGKNKNLEPIVKLEELLKLNSVFLNLKDYFFMVHPVKGNCDDN